MADRVHPSTSPENPMPADDVAPKQQPPPPPKQSKTYVIQVPKDQIYRLPPPENAQLFESYSRRARCRRSSCCCRCIGWTLFVVFLLLLLFAIAAAVLYLVFQPKIPSYSIDRLAIRGFNLNLTAGPISPEFDLTLRADNSRNEKVGLKYEDGSHIGVYYAGELWSRGVWPAFHQPSRNVTVIKTVLETSGVRLSGAEMGALVKQQKQREVPLEIDVKVDVRVKLGKVSSPKVTVKARCEVVVDKMSPDLKMVSKDCRTKVKF